MANSFFVSRSNSFPTQSHPLLNDVEDQLRRLRAFEDASASSSSICSNMACLRDLQEDINNLMQTSSIRQALISQERQGQILVNELLDESLVLLDLCGFARDVPCLKKGSLQELQSSIRRNMHESATFDEINVYLSSQKKIVKQIKKYNLKSFDNNYSTTSSANDDNNSTVMRCLKEAARLDFLALKSVLAFISDDEVNGRSKLIRKGCRSWFSKFMKANKVHSEAENDPFFSLKQLKEYETSIKELEEGLEDLFRTLVKTRVSILNVLTN